MVSANNYRAPSVKRALDILELVAKSSQGLGISDLARRLKISKGTVFGILNQLEEKGALIRGPVGKNYSLGPWLNALSSQGRAYIRLREVCGPEMHRLRDELNQSIFMGVATRKGVTVLEARQAAGVIGISAGPGTRLPLSAGAVGKVFLAGLPDLEVNRVLEKGLRKHTPHTVTDPDQLKSQLKEIRARGYAVEENEYLMGVWAASASLGASQGLPAALWSVGFIGSLAPGDLNELGLSLHQAADRIMALLSG
ncbi:IclR family transcriptional regulator [Dethiosulfatarculus sandiegensis]|uniref:IclR family transcriptional regulator n=1 Tax=Dethiosulfatarculus sandiegensis TaxID=1429043 RepID=A0A0D2GJY8_9BACT|nr:IclR family transcriptional regulator [Dethiosulfatarculus sandiegensis]KIX15057.1 hypothetical protein X474_06005 [Dethiosulfatarculus sandiegensis]